MVGCPWAYSYNVDLEPRLVLPVCHRGRTQQSLMFQDRQGIWPHDTVRQPQSPHRSGDNVTGLVHPLLWSKSDGTIQVAVPSPLSFSSFGRQVEMVVRTYAGTFIITERTSTVIGHEIRINIQRGGWM